MIYLPIICITQMTQTPHMSAPRSLLGGAPLQVDSWVKAPKELRNGTRVDSPWIYPILIGSKWEFLFEKSSRFGFLAGFFMPGFWSWFKHTLYIGSFFLACEIIQVFQWAPHRRRRPPPRRSSALKKVGGRRRGADDQAFKHWIFQITS